MTIVAALLRFWTLGDQSFNHDEAVTASRVLHGDFLSAMQVVVNGERSPPLYYALAWPWSRLFGLGAVGLRSLSALAGTATVPFAYLAARELASKRAGALAAILVALNPYLIWYSQEARSYALLVLFATVGLWFFARALRAPRYRTLALWAIASSLALCTHYFAIFAILPEGALLLARHGPARRLLTTIAAIACVGLALLPLAVVQEGSGRGNGFSQFPVAQRAETAIVKYVASEGPAPQGGLSSTSTFQRQAGLAGVALFAIAIALGLARGSPRERSGLLTAGAVALGAFGTPLLLAFAGADYVDPRNMIAAVVPALVAAGIGLSAPRALRLGAAATLAASILFVIVLRTVDSTPALQRHDWRAGVAALRPGSGARLYVVPADGRSPVEYYTGQRLPKFLGHRFRGGIATRRIVVLSDAPDVRTPASGFHLAATRLAPQHWTVKTYVSARPRAVTPARLRRRNVMPLEPSTALAQEPRRLRTLEAGVDRRQAIEASLDTGHGA